MQAEPAPAVSEPTERERFVDEIFDGIIALVDARLKALHDRIREVEKRPPPAKGDPGKDADVAAVAAAAVAQIREEMQLTLRGEFDAVLPDVIAKAAAKIPAPEPGKDADSEAIKVSLREDCHETIRKLLDEDRPGIVAAVVQAVPKPEPGKDAPPVDIEAVALLVADAAMPALKETVTAQVAEAWASVKIPEPIKGDPGKDAVIDDSALRVAALAAMDELDIPGIVAAASAELIGKEVAVAVSEIKLPEPIKGDPGEPGQTPTVDLDAVAQKAWAMLLPNLEKQVADMSVGVAAELYEGVKAKVAEIPKPKDAEPVDYAKILEWVTKRIRDEFEERKEFLRGPPGIGRQGEPGGRGSPGAKGEPGRDAADPELIGRVVEAQLSKALSAIHVHVEHAGERDVGVSFLLGEKVVGDFAIHFDTMLFKGLWQQGQTSVRGDVVAWDGSSWHCNVLASTSEPGTNADYTLVSKRGRPGKDAEGQRKPERESEPLRLR